MSAAVEIAVVGGGPAGASAAAWLAEGGREVLVLERTAAPQEKVCGSFLSGLACRELAALGFTRADLGAEAISAVRLSAAGRRAEAKLPFEAWGLSRAALDTALLVGAETRGATVQLGTRLRRITAGSKTSLLELGDGERIAAGLVLLATGKHELPGRRRATRWRGREGMLALKLHLRLGPDATERLRSAVEIHLFRTGYAGLQLVEGGRANLCVVLGPEHHAGAAGDPPALLRGLGSLNRALAEAIDGAEALWPRALAIARVPYGHIARSPKVGEAWPLGDQAAVTPSFTGDGLAIALASGRIAAQTFLRGGTGDDYAAELHRGVRTQMRRAMLLQALVDRPVTHAATVLGARVAPCLLNLAARSTRTWSQPPPHLSKRLIDG